LLLLLVTLLAAAQQIAMPAGSIPLTTEEGRELLLEASRAVAYWQLAPRLETQTNQANCGPCSAVMVLNGLGIPAPASQAHPPYKEFDQTNFFTPGTEAVLPQAKLLRQGATLEELGGMLRAHGLEVTVRHAQDASVEQFRKEASAALGEPGQAVIINYRRQELSQEGGGHFSPLGAYHDSDRFLVLDPARYKYPPWWASAGALFKAMNTPDKTSGKSRGYLLIATRNM